MKAHYLVLFILLLVFALPRTVSGQSDSEVFQLKKGSILTSFALSFTGAELDDSHFDSYDISQYRLDAHYMVFNSIGIGPRLSHSRQSVDSRSVLSEFTNREWVFDYGLQVGYFHEFSAKAGTPVFVFANAGASRIRRELEGERNGVVSNGQVHFRSTYFVGVGAIKPIGKRIALRLDLERLTEGKDDVSYTLSAGLTLTF